MSYFSRSAEMNIAFYNYLWNTRIGRTISIIAMIVILGPVFYGIAKDSKHRNKNIKIFNERFQERCILEGILPDKCKTIVKDHKFICFHGTAEEKDAIKQYTTCLMQRHDPTWKPPESEENTVE